MKQPPSADRRTPDGQAFEAAASDGPESGLGCSPGRRIAVVDDDPGISSLMEAMLSSWKFIPYILPHPFLLKDLIDNGASTDIFLLDVRLPNETTLHWIPRIMDVFPEAKVIVMTGYADTDTVIQAIRSGAFDFLQKPISLELMQHSLQRAVQMQEKDRREKKMLADLQQNHTLLLDQKRRLEFLNERLLETNRAFSTLAQNLDFERGEILKRITEKIASGIIPAIARLRLDHHLAPHAMELDMIISMLRDITSGTSHADPLSESLTSAEARVASLIKKGMTTEKIAEQLYISVDTVKTHRKNIRKKLNITNSQSGLKDYLSKRPAAQTT